MKMLMIKTKMGNIGHSCEQVAYKGEIEQNNPDYYQ